MEYNTARDHLIIPEYGRHVQGMIQHATTIENPRERQAFVDRVVNLVVQMNAQNKNMEDFREKVWKHVYRIAHFQLDVLPPSGVIPKPEDMNKKPERIPYPQKSIHYKHYGYNVQKLVEKARAMQDNEKKDAFSYVIASYMKLAYQTWNREHFVSDDVVISDLEALSEGQLSLHEDTTLEHVPQDRSKSKSQQYHQQGRKQKYQGKGGSSTSNGGGFKRKRNKRK
ncbi:MAG: DUF4290 domain-containing protein [Saprospirales bacterium]|nr:DUF4290 domain-containing protein [Saprospirales bacterium]MBK8489450.1 DUF4290 domain-containing protein [Saprospirales bacterium]